MHTTPLYLWVAALWIAVAAAAPFRGFPYLVWNRTAIAEHTGHGGHGGHVARPVAGLHRNTTATTPVPLVDRDISTFRGNLDDYCYIYGFVQLGEQYGWLHAICNLDGMNMSTFVSTELDLNRCLGNYDNHLDWGVNGGAFASCTGCVSRWMDPQWVDCPCGTINLKDHVYVDANGAVACFDQHGSATQAAY